MKKFSTRDENNNFRIVGGQQYCGAAPFFLTYRNTSVNFAVCNTAGNGEGYANSVTVPTNSWAFIVGTFDGSATKIYVDGGTPVTDPSFTGTFPTNFTDPFVMGRADYSAGCVYYGGKIDDVRIYNRVLTSTEVANLYNLIPSP